MTTVSVQRIVDQMILADSGKNFPSTIENPAQVHGNLSALFTGLINNREDEDTPGWWSLGRDRYLRSLAQDGAYLGGFMYAATNKTATIPIRIKARNPQITKHVQQAAQIEQILGLASEYGQTLQVALEKFAQDYLGTDNGGFLKIVAAGPEDLPLEGQPLGLAHIDSNLCYRTGNPMWPVKYWVQEDGGFQVLHMSRVIYRSQLPSPIRSMHGVGYCAVSRSLRVAKDLLAMLQYKSEKLGVSPGNNIIVGKNVNSQAILKALIASQQLMSDLGLKNFASTTAIGGHNIEIDLLELNRFQQFSEQETVPLAVQTLALIWGLEFNEVLAITNSRASEAMSLIRSRGKLPAMWKAMLEAELNFKFVPKHLMVELEYRDDTGDQIRANIDDIHSRAMQRRLDAGATNRFMEHEIMVRNGLITIEDVELLHLQEGSLSDGTPISTLFFDPNYLPWLTFSSESSFLHPNINTVDTVMLEIAGNLALALATVANSTSTSEVKRATRAVFALQWLKDEHAPVAQMKAQIDNVQSNNNQASETQP